MQGGKASTGAVFCNWTGKDTRLFSKGISLTAASDNAVVRYKQYLALMKKKTPLAGSGSPPSPTVRSSSPARPRR